MKFPLLYKPQEHFTFTSPNHADFPSHCHSLLHHLPFQTHGCGQGLSTAWCPGLASSFRAYSSFSIFQPVPQTLPLIFTTLGKHRASLVRGVPVCPGTPASWQHVCSLPNYFSCTGPQGSTHLSFDTFKRPPWLPLDSEPQQLNFVPHNLTFDFHCPLIILKP